MAQAYPRPAPVQPPPKKKGMNTCLVVALVLLAVSVPVLGVMAALGVYGVRRYLAAAKTAEAKNAIGAIARDAVAAYEREPYVVEPLVPGHSSPTPAHKLCKSAPRVPSVVPAAKKYMPSTADGADFNTGDEDTGWKCLKFTMTQPIYYAYKYDVGAGSGKSGATARGFEASAMGDLNGDGVTSFFARGGDVRNGAVVLSTEIYVENEFE